MASAEHISLASKIKSVHVSLRVRAREIGFSEAWKEHCKRSDKLEEYAACMKQLATAHWNKSETANRVTWIAENCKCYYEKEGYLSEYNRECSLCQKVGLKPYPLSGDQLCQSIPEKLKLLDVGSCYNPFSKFSLFHVLPIDLAPASSDVHKCDFLNISVCDVIPDGTSPVSNMKANSFDIIVFSLFLEYLPSSEQRYAACQNAARLLRAGALLCIVTPDSKHATANAHIMKKWRYAMATLGLLTLKYEKLPHLHCMVFRKCFIPNLAIKWMSRALSHKKSQKENLSNLDAGSLMVIPQDFHNYECYPKTKKADVKCDNDYENTVALFEHLPQVYDNYPQGSKVVLHSSS